MSSSNRIIKKYPNRRLYDTQTSVYITLNEVKQLVLQQQGFRVLDAKTSEDLTRSILLQIILEEEAAGQPILSTATLEQIIRFYGHAMQGMMGTYVEKSLAAFVDVQSRFQEQAKNMSDPSSLPNAEMWSQFMSGQAPVLQGMFSSYIEQSKNMFVQMQEQMQQQAKSVLGGFPGNFPGNAFPNSFPNAFPFTGAGTDASAVTPSASSASSSAASKKTKSGNPGKRS
jgi:polyhydroxyalkanoate synthesis repressor PhaR